MSRKICSVGLAMLSAVYAVSMLAPHASAQSASRKADIRRMLADIYEKQHDMKSASSEYQALALSCPNDAEGHYAFGQFLIRQLQYGAALLQFKKATQLDPSKNDYWAGLGRSQVYTKDMRGALDSYRKAGPQYYKQMTDAQNYLNQVEQVEHYNKQLKQQQKEREDQ
jgi:cytochrome c-type biogenesis protein CcmH/NrfG